MTLPKDLPPLILASASPRRRELVQEIAPTVKCIPSEAREVEHDQLTAAEVAQINAYRKARSVAKRFPDALVIGADTLIYWDYAILGKPSDLNHAAQMLRLLAGQTHDVVTGVCLLHLRVHRQKLFAEHSLVTLRELTDSDIADYFRAVNPLDKAGAYAIQENGDKIVSELEGSFSNVVGLPMERLIRELHAW